MSFRGPDKSAIGIREEKHKVKRWEGWKENNNLIIRIKTFWQRELFLLIDLRSGLYLNCFWTSLANTFRPYLIVNSISRDAPSEGSGGGTSPNRALIRHFWVRIHNNSVALWKWGAFVFVHAVFLGYHSAKFERCNLSLPSPPEKSYDTCRC